MLNGSLPATYFFFLFFSFSFLFSASQFLALLFFVLVAIINAASHVLPATGVICRKKETKGGCGIPAKRLFRPVPLASWQPVCRRWRDGEMEVVRNTGCALQYYTHCGYTLLAKNGGEDEGIFPLH